MYIIRIFVLLSFEVCMAFKMETCGGYKEIRSLGNTCCGNKTTYNLLYVYTYIYNI